MSSGRLVRCCLFVLAFHFLLPNGSVCASLMSAPVPEAIEFNWTGSDSTSSNLPAPEVPADRDQNPELWKWVYGLDGSMGSSVNSVNNNVTMCYFMSVRFGVPDLNFNELHRIDFRFIPDASPGELLKPPPAFAVQAD